MVMNLGLYRLSAFSAGHRRYIYPELTPEDFAAVQRAVLCGLGLDRLIKPAKEPI
jgi:hypothetical protein